MLVIGKLWFTHNMSHAEIEFQITSTASLICFQLVVMVGFANINFMYLYHKRIITVLWSCKTIWGRNIYMLHTHIWQHEYLYIWLVDCWTSLDDDAEDLTEHYNNIREKLFIMPDHLSYLQLDNEETTFKQALTRFKTLNPTIVKKYLPFTVNIDRCGLIIFPSSSKHRILLILMACCFL